VLGRITSTTNPIQFWLYSAWFNFVVNYRRTILGPAWLLVSPALFVGCLGLLFTKINATTASQFIPYFAIGYVCWTLVSGFITSSPTVFQRNQPQILQGGCSLTDIIMVDVIFTVLHFLHQAVIIVIVMLIYGIPLKFYSLVSLVGFTLIIANGIWLSYFFGIVGVRYRDLGQIVQSIVGIAFLATPIIWMPSMGDRSGVLEAFLTFNPLFHFLELIRAPLLGNPIAPLSWVVVLSITVAGFALARYTYDRLSRHIPLWV
jgi:ABC-2 type transport system permease protein